MGFDGETFVAEMRQELFDSGRTLDKATWIERVAQGEATRRRWSAGPASTTGA
jgi:hypothetical protein